MADEHIEERENFCRTCGGRRYASLDRRTGRAIVALPSCCQTEDRCGQAILPGFARPPAYLPR